MRRRMVIWMIILLALLAGIAGGSAAGLAEAREAALDATADLEASRALADRIRRNRSRPTMADERERGTRELTALIEQRAKGAGIGPERLIRISPRAARRVGETVYKEKGTEVILRDVTLKQLTAFTASLTDPAAGLRAHTMRVSAPRPDDTTDSWNAEIVLTYLIYEPAGSPR